MGVRDDTRSQLLLSLLAFAVVLGAYYLNRRRLAGLPPAPPTVPLHVVVEALEPSPLPLSASRVLVVANETVGAAELLGELRRLKNETDGAVSRLRPRPSAAHRAGGGMVGRRIGDRGPAPARRGAGDPRGEGIEADGVIGDYRPLHAMDDAVRELQARPDRHLHASRGTLGLAAAGHRGAGQKEVRRAGPAHDLERAGRHIRQLTASGAGAEESKMSVLQFGPSIARPQSPLRDAITAAYREDEADVRAAAARRRRGCRRSRRRRRRRWRGGWSTEVRAQAHRARRGVDALMQEFSLSSQEGVALMCLAEALLRIPDARHARRADPRQDRRGRLAARTSGAARRCSSTPRPGAC